MRRNGTVQSHTLSDMTGADAGGVPLSALGVGDSCVLLGIGGERALRRRLLDMGLTPGVNVTIRGAAPLGDPLELRLRGYSLSLRRADAAFIKVEKIESQNR